MTFEGHKTASQERRLQSMAITWFKTALPHVMVIAIINEMPRTRIPEGLPNEVVNIIREYEEKAALIRMMLMKQMGLYPGAADLLILWWDKKLEVRFLETKDKAPQSKNQKDFQKRLESIGGIYHIWRSLPELEALCRSWGLLPAAPTPKGATPLSKKQLMANMMHEFNMENKK